jgi:hypothetical protein
MSPAIAIMFNNTISELMAASTMFATQAGQSIFSFKDSNKTTYDVETDTIENTINIKSILVKKNLIELERIIKKEDPSIDVTGSKELKLFICNGIFRIHFINDENESGKMSDMKTDFDKQKNKLVTLITKNDNIERKFVRRRIYNLVFYMLILFYVLGMLFIYIQAIDTIKFGKLNILPGLDASHKKELISTALIAISLFMLFVFVIIDMYQRLTAKHYEQFEELGNCTGDESLTDVVTGEFGLIKAYVMMISMIGRFHMNLQESQDTKKADMIKSILNDYENVNYVNMRQYQITDYKINNSRSKMSHIKYAFFIVSLCGLLSGLYLRGTVPFDLFVGTCLILIVLYITIIALREKQNNIRKKYNWNKLYWNLKATR